MKFLTTLALLICLNSIFAQGFKLAGVEYLNYPSSGIVDATDGSEISFQEFIAFLNIPIKLKNDKTTLLNGLQYAYVDASLENSSIVESSGTSKDLHSLSYSLSLIHKWNKWTTMVQAKPTLATDLENDLSSDDLLVQGTVLLSRKIGRKLNVGAGLVYTTQTGDPILLPAIQLKRVTGKSTLDILLPSRAIFLRHFGPRGKLSIGAMAAYKGGNFHIGVDNFPVGNPDNIDRLKYSRANIGPVVQFKLSRMLVAKAFGGYSVARKYQFEDIDDTTFEYDSDNGPFFSIGINMQVPQKKITKD